MNDSRNDNQRSGVTNRRSFWGYFFKTQEQSQEPHPSHKESQQVRARKTTHHGLSSKMQTIQEKTEQSSSKTFDSNQSGKISTRLLNFIRKPLHLKLRKQNTQK